MFLCLFASSSSFSIMVIVVIIRYMDGWMDRIGRVVCWDRHFFLAGLLACLHFAGAYIAWRFGV